MVVDHLPRIYEVVMKAAADRAQHAQQAQHAQTVQCAEKCAEGRRGAAPTELREAGEVSPLKSGSVEGSCIAGALFAKASVLVKVWFLFFFHFLFMSF